MRIVDLYLHSEHAERIAEKARELGHRAFMGPEQEDLRHVRIVTTKGSPDELLEDLQRDFAETEDADEMYVVVEPTAIAPQPEEDEEDEEPRAPTDEIEAFVAEGAKITKSFVVLAAVSGVLAAAGLIRDSPAVLVGAMVIAPLFKPLAAIGAGAILGKARAALRGAALLGLALGVALVAGAVATFATPDASITQAVEARTGVTAFDLIVALASGVAMAYTLLRRDALAMIGIVVAASLVPAGSAAGVALAFGRWDLLAGGVFTLVSNICGLLIGLVGALKYEQVRSPVWRKAQDGALIASRGLWAGGLAMLILLGINVLVYTLAPRTDIAAVAAKLQEEDDRVLSIIAPEGGAPVIVVEPGLDRGAIEDIRAKLTDRLRGDQRQPIIVDAR